VCVRHVHVHREKGVQGGQNPLTPFPTLRRDS